MFNVYTPWSNRILHLAYIIFIFDTRNFTDAPSGTVRKGICVAKGCTKKVWARGQCKTHDKTHGLDLCPKRRLGVEGHASNICIKTKGKKLATSDLDADALLSLFWPTQTRTRINDGHTVNRKLPSWVSLSIEELEALELELEGK